MITYTFIAWPLVLSIIYEKAFSVYKKGYENMSEFWNSNYNFQNKINEN